MIKLDTIRGWLRPYRGIIGLSFALAGISMGIYYSLWYILVWCIVWAAFSIFMSWETYINGIELIERNLLKGRTFQEAKDDGYKIKWKLFRSKRKEL